MDADALRPNAPDRPSRRPEASRAAKKSVEDGGQTKAPHDGPFSGPYTAPMTWDDVCAHPSLQNLGDFKVELDQLGRVMLSLRGHLVSDTGEIREGPMTWEDVCSLSALQDLPFKIELDHFGRVLMSPATFQHAVFQGEIEHLLRQHLGGHAFPETPLITSIGVRTPDVVWMSDAFFREHRAQKKLEQAPEICVEVQSPANSETEMREKTALYFEKGAREVWVCDLQGEVRFFAPDRQIERSALAPDFPAHISL